MDIHKIINYIIYYYSFKILFIHFFQYSGLVEIFYCHENISIYTYNMKHGYNLY